MIVVCTTTCAAFMDDPETYRSWLINAEAIATSVEEPVRYFAALETDGRGIDPFRPLIDEMDALPVLADYWTYSLDDGRTEVTTGNRIRHLTQGQNLCAEYATDTGASHMLFLAADQEVPGDCLPKLLEVDHPLVGGHVPTYCLGDDRLTDPRWPAEWDVREQPFTAAFILVRRDLFKPMKWRGDGEAGMTDDPAYEHDALRYHGVQSVVRRDVIGRHHPEAIGPVEGRGHDMRVVRS